jgi:hypothetical protein
MTTVGMSNKIANPSHMQVFDEESPPLPFGLNTQEKNSDKYEIIISVDKIWDGFNTLIPIKVTVRNNSSKAIYISKNLFSSEVDLIIKDVNGRVIPQIKKLPIEAVSSDKTTLKVREASYRRTKIQPSSEFIYLYNIADNYKLISSKDYQVIVKKTIYLDDYQTKVEVTSKPLKFMIKGKL